MTIKQRSYVICLVGFLFSIVFAVGIVRGIVNENTTVQFRMWIFGEEKLSILHTMGFLLAWCSIMAIPFAFRAFLRAPNPDEDEPTIPVVSAGTVAPVDPSAHRAERSQIQYRCPEVLPRKELNH